MCLIRAFGILRKHLEQKTFWGVFPWTFTTRQILHVKKANFGVMYFFQNFEVANFKIAQIFFSQQSIAFALYPP